MLCKSRFIQTPPGKLVRKICVVQIPPRKRHLNRTYPFIRDLSSPNDLDRSTGILSVRCLHLFPAEKTMPSQQRLCLSQKAVAAAFWGFKAFLTMGVSACCPVYPCILSRVSATNSLNFEWDIRFGVFIEVQQARF